MEFRVISPGCRQWVLVGEKRSVEKEPRAAVNLVSVFVFDVDRHHRRRHAFVQFLASEHRRRRRLGHERRDRVDDLLANGGALEGIDRHQADANGHRKSSSGRYRGNNRTSADRLPEDGDGIRHLQ